MAETEKTNRPPFTPESQRERWIKYGANVVLACIVVVALAILITVIAQRKSYRVDTTKSGAYSLKPQTINIIKDLKQKVRLVSLYTKQSGKTPEGKDRDPEEYSRPVRDLLEEYHRKGQNIDIEEIDPVENPGKASDLVNDITKRYSKEITKYKEVIDGGLASFKDIKAKLADETAKLKALPKESLGNEEGLGNVAPQLADALESQQKNLEKVPENIDRRRNQQLPDYKGATTVIEDRASDIAQTMTYLLQFFDRAVKEPKITDAGKKYIAESRANYEAMKKLADDLEKKTKDLGALKLDEVRTKLNERNAILVIGENDMRSLSQDQVWKADEQAARRISNIEDLKPRFAGEQQITAAILALTAEKKPKVAFVRPGGAPLTSPGFPPFQPSGPFAVVAERLRDYNFDVIEKDLSGMYAMQAQMQGRPAEPEPSDEELKDAVWIVLSMPQQQQSPMGAPPSIAPKVAEHLKHGGSALLLFMPQGDNLHEALADWGVDVMTDTVAVHEAVTTGAPAADPIEDAQRIPLIFVTREYGDHFITKPIQSLDAVLIPRLVVKTTAAKGVKVTALLPVPQSPTAWGEKDIDTAMRGEPVKFDEKNGDISAPLFTGAVAEKEGGGRIVAIGSLEFATNGLVTMPDPELIKRRIRVSRFPGNSELFTNSVFWLAHMEPLIAISPAAMEVSRISNMSDATLKFWRVGAVLIVLPGLVIVAGATVYALRRD